MHTKMFGTKFLEGGDPYQPCAVPLGATESKKVVKNTAYFGELRDILATLTVKKGYFQNSSIYVLCSFTPSEYGSKHILLYITGEISVPYISAQHNNGKSRVFKAAQRHRSF